MGTGFDSFVREVEGGSTSEELAELEVARERERKRASRVLRRFVMRGDKLVEVGTVVRETRG